MEQYPEVEQVKESSKRLQDLHNQMRNDQSLIQQNLDLIVKELNRSFEIDLQNNLTIRYYDPMREVKCMELWDFIEEKIIELDEIELLDGYFGISFQEGGLILDDNDLGFYYVDNNRDFCGDELPDDLEYDEDDDPRCPCIVVEEGSEPLRNFLRDQFTEIEFHIDLVELYKHLFPETEIPN